MRNRRKIYVLLAAGVGLGGCTTDPAFWDSVALGLDQAAYELATECTWYTDRSGVLRSGCPPVYPTYVAPSNHHHHGRDRHRDGSDRDGSRDDKGDRRDRDGRPDRPDWREPK